MTINDDQARLIDTLGDVVDGARAGRVFGEPVVRDATVVLPVARVFSGGGTGGGTGPTADGRDASGLGGGAGWVATPLGVYVIRDGSVEWKPAVDVNRIVLGGQLVAIAALLVVRAVVRARRRRR